MAAAPRPAQPLRMRPARITPRREGLTTAAIGATLLLCLLSPNTWTLISQPLRATTPAFNIELLRLCASFLTADILLGGILHSMWEVRRTRHNPTGSLTRRMITGFYLTPLLVFIPAVILTLVIP